MTLERHIEIAAAIINAMATFGVDFSQPYQIMGFISLTEMRRDIPRKEFMAVLLSLEGVVYEDQIVKIPTRYFKK